LLVAVAAGAAEVAAAGGVREVAVECRPRPAVRPQWAEAWAAEPHRDPRLAPRARRAGPLVLALAAQLALVRALAPQRVPVRALVRRDRESARADQSQVSEAALGPRPAR
jgi:hypothetical protein